MVSQDKILELLKSYIDKNQLKPKIRYYKNLNWYELLLMCDEYSYKNRFVISEYRNSTVIYLGNNRFDFSDKEFEKKFINKILIKFR